MAIKADYDFKGIIIKDAYIRIERIFGSTKEGWDSLVAVYNVTTVIEEHLETEEPNEITVYNKIEEFNYKVPFNTEERGYVAIYTALTNKFGGITV
jgi:hypothetical protein